MAKTIYLSIYRNERSRLRRCLPLGKSAHRGGGLVQSRHTVRASGRLLGDPVVSALLELESQRSIAAARDTAANEHMHAIGHDVI